MRILLLVTLTEPLKSVLLRFYCNCVLQSTWLCELWHG
jgi:hypothetical protein